MGPSGYDGQTWGRYFHGPLRWVWEPRSLSWWPSRFNCSGSRGARGRGASREESHAVCFHPCSLAGIHRPSVPSCLTCWQESYLRHSFRNQHSSSGPHEGGGPESPHWMDTVLWGLQTLHSSSPAPASPLGRAAVASLGAYRGQSRPLPTLLWLSGASLLAGPRGRLEPGLLPTAVGPWCIPHSGPHLWGCGQR